jgi:diguanylate cyclase (GGDEF)-like protein
MRPSRRVLQLTTVSVACGAVLVGVALVGMRQPQADISELNGRIYPASQALEKTAVEHSASNRAFVAAVTASPDQRGVAIADAQDAGNRASAAWVEYRSAAFDSPAERRLQREYLRSVDAGTGAGATAFGLIDSPDRAAFIAGLALVQETSDRTIGILETIDNRFYDMRRRADLRSAEDSLATMRTGILLAFCIVLVLGLLNAIILLRGAFREERVADAREEEGRREQHRSDLENQLQRGLEMEPNEEATYSVIRAALGLVRPDEPVEVFVADSSRAHFRQVLSTDPTGLPNCSVRSPNDCPAASSGQTRSFPSSTRLDACPYLNSREGPPMSAACIPISIAGTNTGMIHTTGPDGQVMAPTAMGDLELVARKAGDRIGYLRVLARTETQARVDVLTGLLNRRSLEEQAAEVLKRGDEFVVAFADLDHFKLLNDEHGHEIGDRALRLFGRVLRNSVRPADIPGRYGGEEFVVVLPDCDLSDARIVADRLRERLATAIAGATIPAFTVSVGLAAWEAPEVFDDTVARADAALLGAKQQGRDRVIVAGELPAPHDSETLDMSANGVAEPGADTPLAPLAPAAPSSTDS